MAESKDAPKTTTTSSKDPAEEAAKTMVETSSDAQHSTYSEVKPDSEERPPPGRMVEQTRGKPKES